MTVELVAQALWNKLSDISNFVDGMSTTHTDVNMQATMSAFEQSSEYFLFC